MSNVIEKTRDFLTGKKTPITKETAKLLSVTGSICTTEERLSVFMNEVNESILNKAKYQQFRYLLEIPRDLTSESNNILDDFKGRGFEIYNLVPSKEGVYVISWE